MARFRPLFLLGSIALSTSIGCSFSHDAGKENGGSGGAFGGGPDGGFNADRVFLEGAGFDINGDACGSNVVTANHLPPDLLIVLDRSGSMNQNAAGQNCNTAGCTKWEQMTVAINQVVAATQNTINWGLMLFGSGGNGSCAIRNTANVPPGPMNATAIAAAIALPANQPASSTPTRAAEMAAGTYLGGLTDVNPKVILLATDGQPNCPAMGNAGTGDDAAAIAAVGTVYNAGAGTPTYVIGIATTGMGTADMTLSSMAIAGGRPVTGAAQSYYPVADTAQLTSALMTIQSMVNLPCKFTIPGMVTDPSLIAVSVGGSPAPAGSYTVDPGNRGITFIGSTCDALTNGTVSNVQINIGCQILIP